MIKKYLLNQEVPWKMLGIFLTIHILMLVYDITHPDVFLHADRAAYRWGVIEKFSLAFRSGSSIQFLSENGLAGDYLIQGLLLLSIGKSGVILFQVLLALLSGYAVYEIARTFGFSTAVSVAAGSVYLALPHTLIFPHQLISEAIHSPLLVVSLWLMVCFLDRQKKLTLSISAITLGLATFVRPITLLWAFIPSTVLLFRKKIISAALYILFAFIPIFIWMLFMLSNTGHFTTGGSDRDMGHNLYQRISRMSDAMDRVGSDRVKEQYLNQGDKGVISPQQYLRFIMDYPATFIGHSIRDTLVFAFKSGIERLTIDYFMIANEGWRSLQKRQTGWRHRLETEGMGATLIFILETQGLILLISLVGAVVMGGLTLLAFLGIFQILMNWKTLNQVQRSIAVLLITLPLYIWFFSQVVNAMQSRHRAPAEAAIVLLATYGALRLNDYWLMFRMRHKK